MELFEPPPLAAMLDPDPVPGRLRKPASRAWKERETRALADGKGQKQRNKIRSGGFTRVFGAARAFKSKNEKTQRQSARKSSARARERCAHASRASTNGREFRDRIDVPPADGRPDIVSFQKNCGGGKVVANWKKKEEESFLAIRVDPSKSTRYILRSNLAIRARYN